VAAQQEWQQSPRSPVESQRVSSSVEKGESWLPASDSRRLPVFLVSTHSQSSAHTLAEPATICLECCHLLRLRRPLFASSSPASSPPADALASEIFFSRDGRDCDAESPEMTCTCLAKRRPN
jgi:hypothetical protein